MKKIILTIGIIASATFAYSQENINARIITTDEVALTTLPSSQLLRFESPISARWGGVRDCCGDGTPEKQIEKAFTKWVKDKLYEHRDKKFVRYGYGAGKAKCRSRKGSFPDYKRSCGGSASVTAYIEFAKN